MTGRSFEVKDRLDWLDWLVGWLRSWLMLVGLFKAFDKRSLIDNLPGLWENQTRQKLWILNHQISLLTLLHHDHLYQPTSFSRHFPSGSPLLVGSGRG